jgi:hypothetical protein
VEETIDLTPGSCVTGKTKKPLWAQLAKSGFRFSGQVESRGRL